MAKKQYVIRRKKYIAITALIFLLFFSFLAVFELSYSTKNQTEEQITVSMDALVKKEKALQQNQDKRRDEAAFCIYVASKQDVNRASYEKAMQDLKISYQFCESIDEITPIMRKQAKVILLGDHLQELGDISRLKLFIADSIDIVFTKMPDEAFLSEYDLYDMLGIRKFEKVERRKGLRLQEGFLLGGREDFEKYEYDAAIVKLLNSCKVYISALPEKGNPLKLTNEELPPLLWRNLYQGCKIFTINGSFLEESSVNGFVAAIFSEIMEDYIYPVVGEIVFVVENFPYYVNVDSKELQDLYSRDALLLQRDILWPDMIGIGKREELQITYYASEHFSKGGEGNRDDISKQRDFYTRSLRRSGGQLNEMNSGKSLEEEMYVPIALDGFYLSDQKKMQHRSILTAYAAIIQRIDIEQIVFPENKSYDWVKASKNMKETIGYYVNRFRMLPSKTVSDAAISARAFQVCDPVIRYEEDQIHISTGDKEIDYPFLLRTDKIVKRVNGGIAKEMERGTYLITVTSEEAVILLKENPLKTYEDSNPLKKLEEVW